MAKFCGREFSLWLNFASANFRYGEILSKRNFASVDAKFRQDNSEISFDSTKIREFTYHNCVLVFSIKRQEFPYADLKSSGIHVL